MRILVFSVVFCNVISKIAGDIKNGDLALDMVASFFYFKISGVIRLKAISFKMSEDKKNSRIHKC